MIGPLASSIFFWVSMRTRIMTKAEMTRNMQVNGIIQKRSHVALARSMILWMNSVITFTIIRI